MAATPAEAGAGPVLVPDRVLEIIRPGEGQIRVSAIARPFSMARIDFAVEAGATLAEIFAQAQPDGILRRHAHIFVGDCHIPRENWRLVRPKPGAHVTIRVLPMDPGGGGGGKKNPLRTILTIAVLAAAAAVSGGALGPAGLAIFGSSFAAGATGATLLAAGIGIVGSLLVNAIAPPSRPDIGQLSSPAARESPVFGLTGGRNELRPFAPVPRVLGKHRLWGPKGAREYTEIVGDDQYLRTLIVWGLGPLLLEDFKIGETPLALFDDVEVEHRQGFLTDGPVTLFPADVFEEALGIALLAAESWQVRTSQIDADEISIDLTFLGGLVEFTDAGDKKARTVALELQTSPAGADTWSASVPISVTASRASVVRHTERVSLTRGQYDVRLRRVTADTANSRIFDVVTWTAIRTFTNESPVNLAGVAMTALRIRATSQLSGVVDSLNCIGTSIFPNWDGNDWDQEEATSNPAAIFRAVLQGSSNANPVPDAQIDLDTIEAWHEINAAAGREFNAVIDSRMSVRDVLAAVAASGRASLKKVDNRWSVAIDAQQASSGLMFTPRNSRNFSATKTFLNLPHALRVTFINRDQGYRPDEVFVYRDGYDALTATIFDGLKPFGVTNVSQAWLDGTYHFASAILRPERYEFEIDIEHMPMTRGDLFDLSHDVLLVGLSTGRIKSTVTDGGGNITSIVTDEVLPMEADKDYALIVRTVTGGRVSATVATNVGEQTTVALSPALAPGSGVVAGDLFAFGEAGVETIPCLVHSMRRHGNDAAIVTAIPESAAIYTADAGPIPEFESRLSPLVGNDKPSIVNVRSDESVMVRNSDGSLDSRILVTLGAPGSLALSRIFRLEAYYRPSDSAGAWNSLGTFARDEREISVRPVEDGEKYDMQFRYVFRDDQPGEFTTVAGHMVLGKLTPPPAVTTFNVARLADGTRKFEWSSLVIPPDVANGGGYVIRYGLGTGVAWEDMADLFTQGLLKTSPVETNELAAGTYTFGIKMVDGSGNESNNAATIEAVLGDPRLRDAIHHRLERGLGWPGDKTDCFVNSNGYLEAIGDPATGRWADLPDTWAALADTWLGIVPSVSPIVYVTETIDLGADRAFTPLATFSGLGTPTIEMETGTDADGAPTGGYVALAPASARYIRIRLTVAGAAILARELAVILDGETKVINIEDINTASSADPRFESIAAGHFKYETDGTIGGIITAQIVAFQNDGDGGRKVDLLSKATTITGGVNPAAEFKMYKDIAGTWTLADATVDLEIKGYKV
jgi:hypothetical protein